MTLKTLRIATRESPLALWQAEHVQRRLLACHDDLRVELVPMSTRGDRWLKTPLSEIGGKNLFVKELEDALRRGDADIAVHSMKDVASELPDDFDIVCVLERESPWDVLVSNRHARLDDLPAGAIIGTCSPRRIAQLKRLNRGWEIRNLRGNVNTRLAKLDAGDYDAIILAAAGLERLALHERIADRLSPDVSLPAIGQGIIGIETLRHRQDVTDALLPLQHPETRLRLTAERAFSRRLEGGCSAPMAGYCTLEDDRLTLTGRVIALDGSDMLADEHSCEIDEVAAATLGTEMANRLIARGARRILDDAERIAAAARQEPEVS